MSYPTITFRDENGRLPEADGVPHIRQFQGEWWVELSRPWEGRVVLHKANGKHRLDLVSEDGINWHLPPDTTKKERVKKAVKAPAGRIIVKLVDGSGALVGHPGAEAVLNVLPANLSEKELETMLQDLGLLALSTSTYLYDNITTPIQERFGERQPTGVPEGLRGYFQSAESIIRLGRSLQQNWPLIARRPLKEIKVEKAASRVYHQIRSPELLVKRLLRGPNKPQLGLTRVSSPDCLENQFLCHVLDRYLIMLAEGVASGLQELIGEQPEHHESILSDLKDLKGQGELKDFAEQAETRLLEAKQRAQRLKESIGKAIGELNEIIAWSKRVRKAPFLKNVSTPYTLPSVTQRLLGTPGYAGVVRTFFEIRKTSLQGLEHALSLFTAVKQGNVRATWELYEIWCLARLYRAFTKLNLQPEGKSLFDQLEIRRGELLIPRNSRFRLQGTIPNGSPKLIVDIFYERELPRADRPTSVLRPDIFVEVLINEDKKLQLAFDAKYRDYEEQGIAQLVEDVQDCARDKYLKPFNLNASFILHTDENRDFWGETSLREHLGTTEADDQPMAHRLGAVSLRPDPQVEGDQSYARQIDKQLNKILGLILHYHGEQADICIHCARKLTAGSEIRLRTSGVLQARRAILNGETLTETELINVLLHPGVNNRLGIPLYCSCEQCGRFWVIQHCVGNPDHAILKTGELCLHERDQRNGGWWYKCPICGAL